MDIPTETPLLTRAQANAEIARRLWPQAEIELLPASGWVNVTIYDKPNETRSWRGFDAFNDHEAAREIVRRFNTADLWLSRRFTTILADDPDFESWHEGVYCGLLATPAQIAQAACKVWGIELEEGAAQ